jgi:hypothetical protein
MASPPVQPSHPPTLDNYPNLNPGECHSECHRSPTVVSLLHLSTKIREMTWARNLTFSKEWLILQRYKHSAFTQLAELNGATQRRTGSSHTQLLLISHLLHRLISFFFFFFFSSTKRASDRSLFPFRRALDPHTDIKGEVLFA